MRKSGYDGEVIQRGSVERGGAAAVDGEADVAVRGHGDGDRADGRPARAVGAAGSGDGVATADEAHPDIRRGAAAARGGGHGAAGGGAPLPAPGAAAIDGERAHAGI